MNRKYLTAKMTRTPRFFLVLFLALLASWRFDVVADGAPSTLPVETQKQIEKVLDAPNLQGAHVGISILDLGLVKDASTFPAKPYIGKPFRVLFERDAQKKFMPASNMKLFTAAIALQLLGKDKTFPTRVLRFPIRAKFDWDKYVLLGGGDPSLNQDDLRELARSVAASPVTEREIQLLDGESRIFNAETSGKRYPFGWTLDDTLWYYGPEISGLALNRNQVDVTITGGAERGAPAQIECVPFCDSIFIKASTGDPDLKSKSDDDLFHAERLSYGAKQMLAITGEAAPQQKITNGFAIPDPALWATQQFASALQEQKIKVDAIEANQLYASAETGVGSNIAQHNSPPLKTLFQCFLKNSDNLYAEMLLRDAAYYYDGTGGDKAGPHAHELLKKWLIENGIDVSTLRFEDGSGLSRYNLLTPRAEAGLLAAINRMKDGVVIYNALPIAGVDGTLKTRMASTPAANNARAKTGTFSIASNLSGYVTTRDNHRLAVALFINFARDTDVARAAQDQIYEILAGASWKRKS